MKVVVPQLARMYECISTIYVLLIVEFTIIITGIQVNHYDHVASCGINYEELSDFTDCLCILIAYKRVIMTSVIIDLNCTCMLL